MAGPPATPGLPRRGRWRRNRKPASVAATLPRRDASSLPLRSRPFGRLGGGAPPAQRRRRRLHGAVRGATRHRGPTARHNCKFVIDNVGHHVTAPWPPWPKSRSGLAALLSLPIPLDCLDIDIKLVVVTSWRTDLNAFTLVFWNHSKHDRWELQHDAREPRNECSSRECAF